MRLAGTAVTQWILPAGKFLGAQEEKQGAGSGRRAASSSWGGCRPDEGPVGLRAELFAQQDAVALTLQVDRDLFGARPVAVADLSQVIERRAASGCEGVPGFHRDGVQVVDELHVFDCINC